MNRGRPTAVFQGPPKPCQRRRNRQACWRGSSRLQGAPDHPTLLAVNRLVFRPSKIATAFPDGLSTSAGGTCKKHVHPWRSTAAVGG